MTQPQRRITKVIRVPRRYEYLCKAFTCYLATLPPESQAQLWGIEDTLGALSDDAKTEAERQKHLANTFQSHFAGMKV
ncbi:MAG: hypothetical protein F6K32_10925 [Desertifilum sp. SIO1I2]|nr:hypothetical protein [Desertifilum sp. SIO1I2]